MLSGAVLGDPRDEEGRGVESVSCSGAFLAIGHKPMTRFLEPPSGEEEPGARVELDDGYIVQKEVRFLRTEKLLGCGESSSGLVMVLVLAVVPMKAHFIDIGA